MNQRDRLRERRRAGAAGSFEQTDQPPSSPATQPLCIGHGTAMKWGDAPTENRERRSLKMCGRSTRRAFGNRPDRE